MNNVKQNNDYPIQMDSEYVNLINTVFGDYLVCSFISGRASFQIIGQGMDIDVCVVLKDTIIKQKELFRSMWKRFVVGYRDLHIKYCFKPDNAFPGDFLTVSQTYDVISGRGFVQQNSQIYIQPMGNITDESDENDYRIFRSMFIIGRCISGNAVFFEEAKRLSIETMLKYFFILKKSLTKKQIIEELLSGKEKEKYGFNKRYEPYFSQFMLPRIQNALDRLTAIGYVTKTTDGGYTATPGLYQWGKDVLSRVWSSTHLMRFQDPYWVKKRKEIFANITAGSHWDKLS